VIVSRVGTVAVSLLFLLGVPIASHAQRLPESPPAFGGTADPVASSSQTYWRDGALIGGALVASTAVYVAFLWCSDSDSSSGCSARNYLVSGAFGATIGVATGALVGSLFTAPSRRPLQGHPVRAAIIGSAVGALWIAGLCHGVSDGCGSDETRFLLSFTAIGAVAGLVASR
jgi:hypothetical protein